jgi:hypothetical protein
MERLFIICLVGLIVLFGYCQWSSGKGVRYDLFFAATTCYLAIKVGPASYHFNASTALINLLSKIQAAGKDGQIAVERLLLSHDSARKPNSTDTLYSLPFRKLKIEEARSLQHFVDDSYYLLFEKLYDEHFQDLHFPNQKRMFLMKNTKKREPAGHFKRTIDFSMWKDHIVHQNIIPDSNERVSLEPAFKLLWDHIATTSTDSLNVFEFVRFCRECSKKCYYRSSRNGSTKTMALNLHFLHKQRSAFSIRHRYLNKAKNDDEGNGVSIRHRDAGNGGQKEEKQDGIKDTKCFAIALQRYKEHPLPENFVELTQKVYPHDDDCATCPYSGGGTADDAIKTPQQLKQQDRHRAWKTEELRGTLDHELRDNPYYTLFMNFVTIHSRTLYIIVLHILAAAAVITNKLGYPVPAICVSSIAVVALVLPFLGYYPPEKLFITAATAGCFVFIISTGSDPIWTTACACAFCIWVHSLMSLLVWATAEALVRNLTTGPDSSSGNKRFANVTKLLERYSTFQDDEFQRRAEASFQRRAEAAAQATEATVQAEKDAEEQAKEPNEATKCCASFCPPPSCADIITASGKVLDWAFNCYYRHFERGMVITGLDFLDIIACCGVIWFFFALAAYHSVACLVGGDCGAFSTTFAKAVLNCFQVLALVTNLIYLCIYCIIYNEHRLDEMEYREAFPHIYAMERAMRSYQTFGKNCQRLLMSFCEFCGIWILLPLFFIATIDMTVASMCFAVPCLHYECPGNVICRNI